MYRGWIYVGCGWSYNCVDVVHQDQLADLSGTFCSSWLFVRVTSGFIISVWINKSQTYEELLKPLCYVRTFGIWEILWFLDPWVVKKFLHSICPKRSCTAAYFASAAKGHKGRSDMWQVCIKIYNVYGYITKIIYINLRWRVQNLVSPSPADMIDQGNQLKQVSQCKKCS